ncbi:MAG: hypothetical protein V1862_04110, partial [Methanobacteriota archaeon]
MERRDIMVIAGALIVVLILAVVVKPMLTGQAPNLGIPQATPAIPSESVLPGVTGEPLAPIATSVPAETSVNPSIPPSPS